MGDPRACCCVSRSLCGEPDPGSRCAGSGGPRTLSPLGPGLVVGCVSRAQLRGRARWGLVLLLRETPVVSAVLALPSLPSTFISVFVLFFFSNLVSARYLVSAVVCTNPSPSTAPCRRAWLGAQAVLPSGPCWAAPSLDGGWRLAAGGWRLGHVGLLGL